MEKLIRTYYKRQLIVSFIFAILVINLSGALNAIDYTSKGKLLLLSLVGGVIFSVANGLINALNLQYPKQRNTIIAFSVPFMIWLLPSVYSIKNLLNHHGDDTVNWVYIILFMEAMVYTLLLQKRVERYENNSVL